MLPVAQLKLSNIVRNQKVHHRTQNSPPVVPTLTRINPLHITPSYIAKIYLNIICPRTFWSSCYSISFWLSQQ
jgi:hypothetical protein